MLSIIQGLVSLMMKRSYAWDR